MMASAAGGQRRGFALEEFVDADDDLLAALDRLEPPRIRFDEPRFHIAALDRSDRAAHRIDDGELVLGLRLELLDLARDLAAALEEIAEFEEVGLIGHDLLHAQRPLLIERPRQAERLVPGRQLHGAGAGISSTGPPRAFR